MFLSARPRPLIISLSLVFTLLTSCSSDPNVRKQKYFQAGQSYYDKGKYQESAIEYLNAIKIDSNFAQAHYQLAESYLKLQNARRALEEFQRTLELQPDNHASRKEAARLLIVGNDFQQAQEQINLLLKALPNDPEVHSINSSLLASQGDVAGGIGEMQKSISLDPDRWQPYLSLALLQLRDHRTDEAEESFKKVIALNPTASQARLVLGGYYLSKNRYSEAEQEFRQAVAIDPKNAELRGALVQLYVAQGKKSDAEAAAKQAKADLPNDYAGYSMLGKFYFTNGDLSRAIEEYDSLHREHPDDLRVKKDYVQLLLQQGRIADAERLNRELVKSNPNDNDVLVFRSQIQISSGQASDAANTLQTVIKNDPNNAEAHYVLGVDFQKLNDLPSAEREWREAVHLRPELLDAWQSLANLSMRKGDMETLEQSANQMIALRPSYAEGYALRALSNINRRRFSEAETDVHKAIDVAPQSSFGYVQLGNLKFAEHQFADAAQAYQSALERKENSTDALRGLMNSYIAQKQIDRALAIAEAQISKVPNDGSFYNLLGTVLFYSKHDLPAAEAAFIQSSGLDRQNPDSLIKLGQVQAAEGRSDQALATYRQSIQDYPQEVSFYLLLGDLYQSKRDWPEAGASYQKALGLTPENPLASAKLAYVMLQSGQNLDVALSLAQTARRGLPASPAIAGTLGWIYYQKGAFSSAIDSLQEALRLERESKSPDNPEVHFHLGMAYAKNGQAALARQQLQIGLKISPDSPDAADARKQLAHFKSAAS